MDIEQILNGIIGSDFVMTSEMQMIFLGVICIVIMILLFTLFQSGQKKDALFQDVDDDIEDILLNKTEEFSVMDDVDDETPTMNGAKTQHADNHSSTNNDYIALTILAYEQDYFYGDDLLQAFMDENLFYGDMDIFHRYNSHVNKTVIFSVVNACEPGCFDLDKIDNFKTRGITFFMMSPFTEQSLGAYDEMLNTAKRIADKLGGELVDQKREMLTPESINYHRSMLFYYQDCVEV